MSQQGKAAKVGEAEVLPAVCLALGAHGLAKTRQGPGDQRLARNSLNNSPEFWGLFLDLKAKEKREKN